MDSTIKDLIEVIVASPKEIPIMAWGPPGIGKSDGVREAALRLSKILNRRVSTHTVNLKKGEVVVKVYDVRLSQMDPVDIRGLPSKEIKDGEAVAAWLRPEFLPPTGSEEHMILFLDEINAAPPSVQAAAYQLVLDRKIGEYVLPPNCKIVCAGNRKEDYGVTHAMPSPLANRLLHIDVVVDVDIWKEWAYRKGIHSSVIGFITWKPDALFSFNRKTASHAWPSPRTWEYASRILTESVGNPTVKTRRLLLAGCVGDGTATEFSAFLRVHEELPNPDDILAGKSVPLPTEDQVDVLYALVTALVSRISQKRPKKVSVQNFMKCMGRLPAEFATCGIRDAAKSPARSILATTAEFKDWIRDNKDVLT